MTDYYNINFNNDDSDKLDKLAREINNKKTSLCKKVTEEFDKNQQDWKNGINTVINAQKFSYLPMNKNFNKKINNNPDNISVNTFNLSDSESYKSNSDNSNFSDFASLDSNDSNFASKDNKYFKNNDNYFKNSDNYFKNNDNYSTDSVFIDSESIDTYLKNPKYKKNPKFNKLVESVDYDECSKNDDNIFDHIKKCNNCKNKLLKFLNGSYIEDSDNKICNFFTNDQNKKESLFNNIKNNNINMKEIVILIMIGIFIIIMLDLLLKSR